MKKSVAKDKFFVYMNKQTANKMPKGDKMPASVFNTLLNRVYEATGINSQKDLAKSLGVNRSAITQARNKDAFPDRWLLQLYRLFGLNPDWVETGTGPTPTHTYSMADIYIVTLTVTSDTGATDSDNAIAVIEPANEPPDCSRAYPSRRKLWPPNHKFKKVRILNVTDPDGDPVNIVIDSIYQDEPVGKKPDARGVGTHIARLRAERIRAKKGNGRVYHINFTAYDDKGASCSGHVTVGVPTNRGKKAKMIDDGALFDSTITQ